MFDKVLVWLRRDLRAQDNAALHQALQSARQVYCAFVLDQEILTPLPRADRRVEFILDALGVVDTDLRHLNPVAGLIVRQGRPAELIPELAMQLGVQAVFYNHDDEPAALLRDAEVAQQLGSCAMHSFKDHVIFERSEVLTAVGKPYGVFTPYKNSWLRRLRPGDLESFQVEALAAALGHSDLANGVPSLAAIGFQPAGLSPQLQGGRRGAADLLEGQQDRSAIAKLGNE